MQERTGLVTLLGTPVTLTGAPVEAGDKAPEFRAMGNDMAPMSLSDLSEDRVVVLLSVPSLDTPVCDTEARRFNQEAASFGADVCVLAISNDLPFAQQRWCGNAGIDRVIALSDYLDCDFGQKYGVLMKEVRLLARAVWVVAREGTVVHHQLVAEVGDEPDYAAALDAVREALK